MPALRDAIPEPRTLIFEHEGHAAIRRGDWKLVGRGVVAGNGLRHARWELYDVAADPAESRDLAAARPDMVAELTAAFEAEARRTFVLPAP